MTDRQMLFADFCRWHLRAVQEHYDRKHAGLRRSIARVPGHIERA
jgi:hypothetical protein